MSFCGTCGSALTPEAKFCGRCGTKTVVHDAAELDTPPDARSTTPHSPGPPAGPPPGTPADGQATSPTTSSTGRTLMWIAAAGTVLAGVAGVVYFTRDDGDDSPSTASTGTVAAATTNPPATAPPTTVAPTTPPTTVGETTTPATTVAATTSTSTSSTTSTSTSTTTVAPTTTAAPLVPSGWTAATVPEFAFPAIGESNWRGVPSPAVADAASPLLDGVYHASYVVHDADSITLDIRRLELCTVLGQSNCLYEAWEPDELGVVDLPVTRSVPLDSNLRVVIQGWECNETAGQANGADLATLYTELRQDYEVAFGSGIAAGEDPSAMMDAVRAAPVARFGPAPDECADNFSLRWRYDGAPTIAIYWPFDYLTDGWQEPALLLPPTVLEVEGDLTTLHLYGGYYP